MNTPARPGPARLGRSFYPGPTQAAIGSGPFCHSLVRRSTVAARSGPTRPGPDVLCDHDVPVPREVFTGRPGDSPGPCTGNLASGRRCAAGGRASAPGPARLSGLVTALRKPGLIHTKIPESRYPAVAVSGTVRAGNGLNFLNGSSSF